MPNPAQQAIDILQKHWKKLLGFAPKKKRKSKDEADRQAKKWSSYLCRIYRWEKAGKTALFERLLSPLPVAVRECTVDFEIWAGLDWYHEVTYGSPQNVTLFLLMHMNKKSI